MPLFRKPLTVHHDLAKSDLWQCGTLDPGAYGFNAEIYAQPSQFGKDDIEAQQEDDDDLSL